jgi:hypothetical protein
MVVNLAVGDGYLVKIAGSSRARISVGFTAIRNPRKQCHGNDLVDTGVRLSVLSRNACRKALRRYPSRQPILTTHPVRNYVAMIRPTRARPLEVAPEGLALNVTAGYARGWLLRREPKGAGH